MYITMYGNGKYDLNTKSQRLEPATNISLKGGGFKMECSYIRKERNEINQLFLLITFVVFSLFSQ